MAEMCRWNFRDMQVVWRNLGSGWFANTCNQAITEWLAYMTPHFQIQLCVVYDIFNIVLLNLFVSSKEDVGFAPDS